MAVVHGADGQTAPDGVVVVLRPLGVPLAVGLSGLGIASAVQSGLDLRWFPAGESMQAGLILLAVPFVLQFFACVLAYLARDGAAGAALGVLATTWLAIGLVHISAGPGQDGVEGLLLVSAAVALAASGATVARANPLAGGVFVLAATRFAVGGIFQLGGPVAWRDASGILGLVLCALALYAVLAFDLEGQAHRPLLPTFRRGQSPAEGLYAEPGVRDSS